MPALAEVHLVSDPDDPREAVALQMSSLSDHLADLRKAGETRRLGPAERVALEVRHDGLQQVTERTSLVLPGSVATRLADPADFEETLQILEERLVLLVPRQRGRRPRLAARSELV